MPAPATCGPVQECNTKVMSWVRVCLGRWTGKSRWVRGCLGRWTKKRCLGHVQGCLAGKQVAGKQVGLTQHHWQLGPRDASTAPLCCGHESTSPLCLLVLRYQGYCVGGVSTAPCVVNMSQQRHVLVGGALPEPLLGVSPQCHL